ncbi:MAG: FtsQ-type POTRA domain-containing protein [Gordonibacter sp.]|uniref:cell division protein FtsQ/DivIB n=1 Tax=Gordonibacter sp. TaxID=1968902 RepID=UPI002FC5B059
MPGGRYASRSGGTRSQQRLTSVRVGDVAPRERGDRAQKTYRRYVVRLAVIAGVAAALIIGGIAVYGSSLFAIENVSVTGVEHLTSADMEAMASVPADTTLLRVDASGIRNSLLQNAWVQDVEVKRVFPNTLELAVTERTIKATVEVPTDDAKTVRKWAVASDHMWLMPIPDQDSEAGKKTSPKIYEDAAAALSVVDVPYGTKAGIGTYCTDATVNNALDIVSGMTTELSGRVKTVSAAGAEETKLVLDDGTEIAFGKAENIRDKERVVLKIMEENPGVVYVNVRVVERPTWRSLS